MFNAIENVFGDSPLTRGSEANQFLFGGTDVKGTRIANGVWDDVSRRFVDATTGDIVTVTPFSKSASVFGATELQAALDNPNVTSINGMPKAMLSNIKTTRGIDAVFDAVNFQSWMNTTNLELVRDVNGVVTDVGTDKFFSAVPGVSGTVLPDTTPGKLSASRLMNTMTDVQWVSLQRGDEFVRDSLKAVGDVLPPKTLSRLGMIGFGASVLFLANDVNAAVGQGDMAKAERLVAEWSAEELGGAVAGGLITALAGAGLVAAGVPAGLATVLGLSAWIIGGYFGGEATKNTVSLMVKVFGEMGISLSDVQTALAQVDLQRLSQLDLGLLVSNTDINRLQLDFTQPPLSARQNTPIFDLATDPTGLRPDNLPSTATGVGSTSNGDGLLGVGPGYAYTMPKAFVNENRIRCPRHGFRWRRAVGRAQPGCLRQCLATTDADGRG